MKFSTWVYFGPDFLETPSSDFGNFSPLHRGPPLLGTLKIWAKSDEPNSRNVRPKSVPRPSIFALSADFARIYLGPYLRTPSSDFHEILATSGGHAWDPPHQILGKSDEGVLRYGPKYMLSQGLNTKVLGLGTEFGRTFLEFRSSDSAQIFSVPRGGGPPVEGRKNSEI